MSQTFSSLITTNAFAHWRGFCNLLEVKVSGGSLDQWKSYVATYMRSNYLPSHLNEALHESDGRNKTDLSSMIDNLIPNAPDIQTGDLGEAVCSLILTEVLGKTIPYLKWANKNSVNFSEPGVDLLAFQFDSAGEDEMLIVESRVRDREALLTLAIVDKKNGMIAKFKGLTPDKICSEINLTLKKIETDSKKDALYRNVLDFLNAFRSHGRMVKDLASVMHDSTFDSKTSLLNLRQLTGTGRPIEVISHSLEQIHQTVKDVFQGIRTV